MYSKRTHLEVLLIITVCITFILANEAFTGEMFILSIPQLATAKQEKIVGFKVNVTAGRIVSFPNAPIGWNITINNDPSWHTQVIGSIIVGAASLGSIFFRDFLTIEKYEFMGLKFNVDAEIVVTEDFEIERHLYLKMKNLSLRKR